MDEEKKKLNDALDTLRNYCKAHCLKRCQDCLLANLCECDFGEAWLPMDWGKID